jgi:protein SCO1/2
MTDPAANGSRLVRVRLVLWALVAIALLAALYLMASDRSANPPPNVPYSASLGGPFTLTAADGSAFTEKSLKGTPTAVFFGFTRCPDVCPTTLARLAKLRGAMGSGGDKLRIVFVSVDADRDTPQSVGDYVALFHTPIVGLTGTAEQVAAAAKAFHVYYEKVPMQDGEYTVDHTATVFLLDRDGKLRSTIDAQEADSPALEKLRRLVA